MKSGLLSLSTILLLLIRPSWCSSCSCGKDYQTFFQQENELLRQRKNQENLASYKYNTNVTEANRKEMIEIAASNAQKQKELAQKIKALNYADINEPTIQRQVAILSDLGYDVLNERDYKDVKNAISAMQTNYAKANVCSYTDPKNCTLSLEPHIEERLANSRDPKELEHYWRQWHDKAGTPMRRNFTKYVQLAGKAAQLNNYASYADYWIHFYEDPDFEKNFDAVYKEILPFYKDIHAYVRFRLREHYGPEIVAERGNIPVHLLGNMWAQQWDQAIDLFTPFPNRAFVDPTPEMLAQNFSVTNMFELGDQFFQSLNMIELPPTFWNLSVIERPTDRPIVCHASAWDFYQDNDVRIKMCTEVNDKYLYVVHHELGHIQYYLQYADQPTVFRNAPNPGFHEAVGDVIALSVSTAKHLNRIGLSSVAQLDEESRLNELFKTALKKIVFLPFAYTMDKYRYAVFRGDLDESVWNCGFWQMRSQYSGIEPPVKRTERDFDPPTKYHVSADVEYARYFAAHIFQFQFHKAMCILAKQYSENDEFVALDNCDIYNNKAAGRAFSKLLSQGASRHWKEVLEEFTGDTKMDPKALLEYFEPLRFWLKEEIQRLRIPVGWDRTDKIRSDCCPKFST